MQSSIGDAGIYANALPYFKGRVDLYELDRDGEELAYRLWQGTLYRNLSLTLQLPAVPAAAIRELYFQTRNHARTHGARSLGLGYPTLLCHEQAELIAAPLLIFEWQLEPSLRRADNWMVQHDRRNRVRPNEWLIGHLRVRTGKDLTKVFQRAAQRPDTARLQRLCDEVADALELTDRADISYPVAFPDLEKLSVLGEAGALLASGVVGQFVPRYFAPAEASDTWLDAGETAAEPPHRLAPVALDPWQTTAVRRALARLRSLVEGSERSGKDRVATWLLLHAATAGERTLVVSDSVPALRKLQRRLTQTGYTDGQYLIRNVVDDLPQLLQVFRAMVARKSRSESTDDPAYVDTLAEAERLRHQLDTAYGALRVPIYGRYNWTETVGLLLEADRREAKEQLGTYLTTQGYAWTYEEQAALQESVRRCRPLYHRLGTLDHPLSALDDAIFLENDAAEARQFIGRRLDRLRVEVSELERAFISAQDGYLADLRDWQYRYAERMEGQVDRWLEALTEAVREHGAELLEAPGWWSRVTRRLRPRQQRLAVARAALRDRYTQWRTMHEDVRAFGAALPAAAKQSLNGLRSVAQQYKNELVAWRSAIPDEAHRTVAQLTARQSFPALGYEQELLRLESEAQVLADRFNAAGLYREGVELRALTIPGLRNELVGLREQLQRTHASLVEFRAFYNWQSVWLRQPDTAQRLIAALVAAAPADWGCALQSWYLYELLSRVDRRAIPEDDVVLEALATAEERLAPLQQNHWEQVRAAALQRALRELRRTQREDYQHWLSDLDPLTAPTQRLLELALRTRPVWQAAFPVLFTTPETARTLFADGAHFDRLLLLGGDRVTRAEVADLAGLADRLTVFGSVPNDRADSLSTELREAGWMHTKLEEYLLENETAILHEHARIEVVEVDGRFAERERVNEVEAQTVVQRLLQIAPTEDRRLPRVGVVCFSEAQRNLIAAHLLEIKQRNAYGSEQIGQLERNGLGLYTIDELYGLPLDVLVLSLTFGRLRHTGNWGRSIAFFDRPEATRHFNYLLRTRVDELIIIHSLPKGTVDDYLLHAVDQGSYLLAAYLRYHAALANGDPDEAAAYLTHFSDDEAEPARTGGLGREIGELLTEYLGADRLTIHERVARLPVDLTVGPRYESEPPVALKADAYFAIAPFTSARWELQQRKKLRGAGYELVPVWTKFWWNTTEQAARKLAAKLIKRDRVFER